MEEKEKFFDCAFYPFRIVLSLFVSFSSSSRFYIGEVIPFYPITSLRVSPKHVITRGHAHIKRTAGVASSSSHHHHHHAHVCGELCQNAVLDVKSNVLPHRHGKQQPSWTTTDTKNDRNNNNNSTTGKRGSISIVPRSDNGAYPHTLSTAIKDPITPHGPRFYEYGGFDIDPELQHNRKAYINERIDVVTKHFPNAIGMDDFLFRTEVMLRRFGFTADNSIALTSLCRDEITFPLKAAIHDIFGTRWTWTVWAG